MKKVNHYEVMEYTYENKSEKDNHIADLYLEGWRDSGKIKRMKDGVSIMDATSEDYEYYAHLVRYVEQL
jgi:hypothetical protein